MTITKLNGTTEILTSSSNIIYRTTHFSNNDRVLPKRWPPESGAEYRRIFSRINEDLTGRDRIVELTRVADEFDAAVEKGGNRKVFYVRVEELAHAANPAVRDETDPRYREQLARLYNRMTVLRNIAGKLGQYDEQERPRHRSNKRKSHSPSRAFTTASPSSPTYSPARSPPPRHQSRPPEGYKDRYKRTDNSPIRIEPPPTLLPPTPQRHQARTTPTPTPERQQPDRNPGPPPQPQAPQPQPQVPPPPPHQDQVMTPSKAVRYGLFTNVWDDILPYQDVIIPRKIRAMFYSAKLNKEVPVGSEVTVIVGEAKGKNDVQFEDMATTTKMLETASEVNTYVALHEKDDVMRAAILFENRVVAMLRVYGEGHGPDGRHLGLGSPEVQVLTAQPQGTEPQPQIFQNQYPQDQAQSPAIPYTAEQYNTYYGHMQPIQNQYPQSTLHSPYPQHNSYYTRPLSPYYPQYAQQQQQQRYQEGPSMAYPYERPVRGYPAEDPETIVDRGREARREQMTQDSMTKQAPQKYAGSRITRTLLDHRITQMFTRQGYTLMKLEAKDTTVWKQIVAHVLTAFKLSRSGSAYAMVKEEGVAPDGQLYTFGSHRLKQDTGIQARIIELILDEGRALFKAARVEYDPEEVGIFAVIVVYNHSGVKAHMDYDYKAAQPHIISATLAGQATFNVWDPKNKQTYYTEEVKAGDAIMFDNTLMHEALKCGDTTRVNISYRLVRRWAEGVFDHPGDINYQRHYEDGKPRAWERPFV